VRPFLINIWRRLNVLNHLALVKTWKPGEISQQKAFCAGTRTVGGMEHGGSVTSETGESRPSAQIQSARCVASSRPRSISSLSRKGLVGGGVGPDGQGKGRMLTRTLEWNLRFCLMEFLFDAQGRVRKVFLKSKNRAALIEG